MKTFSVKTKLSTTVNAFELIAFPQLFKTEIFPDVAFTGTVAVNWLSLLITNDADTPLKLTWLAKVKPEPLIITSSPATPLDGEKEFIKGRFCTVITILSVAG